MIPVSNQLFLEPLQKPMINQKFWQLIICYTEKWPGKNWFTPDPEEMFNTLCSNVCPSKLPQISVVLEFARRAGGKQQIKSLGIINGARVSVQIRCTKLAWHTHKLQKQQKIGTTYLGYTPFIDRSKNPNKCAATETLRRSRGIASLWIFTSLVSRNSDTPPRLYFSH